jgi:hypothetical protein
MNIDITYHQSIRLRRVLAEAFVNAERMAHHPDISAVSQDEYQMVSEICLDIINKLVHATNLETDGGF